LYLDGLVELTPTHVGIDFNSLKMVSFTPWL
jgi:hypothetical protein